MIVIEFKMPLPPFHLGPGALLKSTGFRYFSFSIYILSQFLMDIEVLVRILLRHPELHGFTNTFLGATCIGLLSAIIGKPILHWGLNILRKNGFVKAHNLISWPTASISGLSGAYMHVVLDSIMHADARPFHPLSDDNIFLNFISVENLHFFCLSSGLLGIFILMLRMKHKNHKDQ